MELLRLKIFVQAQPLSNATGGTTYSWSPGIGLSDSTIANPIANPASTTSYQVQVSDANGCSGNGSVTVNVNPLPTISVSANNSTCVGSPVQLSSSGGTTYSWSPSTGLSNPNISNPIANVALTTTYSVLITDANNCSSSATTTVSVNTLPVEIGRAHV